MRVPTHRYRSGLEKIVDFLYRPENLNNRDVVYMNFSADTGVFEDKASGSYFYLEFSDEKKQRISEIQLCLQGQEGIVHRWAEKFQNEFGATVDELR